MHILITEPVFFLILMIVPAVQIPLFDPATEI